MAEAPLKIVFLDRDTLSARTVLHEFDFPHTLKVHPQTSREQVAHRIADADIVITNKAPIDAQALEGADRLRIVAVAATGTDIVDIGACNRRGIIVTNIRQYAINTVPEHTLALMFALRRSILPYHRANAEGRWGESGQFCYFDFPIRDLAGSRIGIIGDGVLGRAVARLATAVGMDVVFAAYKGTTGMGPLYMPFDDVVQTSDVLTLHCPLTPSTENLIDRREFDLMERKPLIINTARGGLVNERALADALLAGRIGGAAFDVVTQEPLPASHPFAALMDRSDFILTPHVAWASEEAMQTLANQLVANIEAAVRGSPKNVVSVSP